MARSKSNATSVDNEQLVYISDLSGGVELNSAQSNLAQDRARRLSNFSLEEPGALVTVSGFKKLSTTSLGAGRLQGGARVYTKAGGAFTMTAFSGSVYKPTDGGVWGSAISTTFSISSTNPVFFPYDRLTVQLYDGATRPQISTDGAAFSRSGNEAPTNAPTLSGVNAGGTLLNANQYEVAYTWATTTAFNADLINESNGSPRALFTMASPNLTLRVVGDKPNIAKMDTAYIYARNVTTGQSVLRRVGSVGSLSGAGTFQFDITTEALESALEIPTINDIPLAFSFGVFWKNRMWAFHPTIKNRLHFSQIFQPQVWPANFFIDIPTEKGDELETAVRLGDTLIVFGHTSVYLILGQTSLDFEVRPSLVAETGALGFYGATKVGDGVVHAGAAGIYLFTGAADIFLSQDIAKGWTDFVENSDHTTLHDLRIAYNAKWKQVNVAVPRLYPSNLPGEYVIDLNRARAKRRYTWFTTDRSIGGYIVLDGNETTSGFVGRIWSWGRSTGEIFEERTGFTANGVAMTAEYEGPAFSVRLRQALMGQLTVEYEPTDGTLGVELLVEGRTISINSSPFDLGSGLPLYGVAQYGVDIYGNTSRRILPILLPLEADGKSIIFKFTYVGSARFRLLGYAFGVTPEPDIRGI